MSKRWTSRASSFVSILARNRKGDITTLDPQEVANLFEIIVRSLVQSNDKQIGIQHTNQRCDPDQRSTLRVLHLESDITNSERRIVWCNRWNLVKMTDFIGPKSHFPTNMESVFVQILDAASTDSPQWGDEIM